MVTFLGRYHPRAVACPRTPAAAFERVRSSRAVGRSPSSGGTTHGLSLVLGRQPPLSSVFVVFELSDDLRLYPLLGEPGPMPLSSVSVALELSDGDPSSGGATHGLSLVLGRQPPLSSVSVALELSDDPVVSPSG